MICVEEMPRFPASIEEVVEDQMDAGHRYEAVVARATAQAKAQGISLKTHVVPGMRCRRFATSYNARASTCWLSAIWATPRSIIVLSAARRIGSSSMPPATCW